jgi:hypothetical protein
MCDSACVMTASMSILYIYGSVSVLRSGKQTLSQHNREYRHDCVNLAPRRVGHDALDAMMLVSS